MTAEKSLRLLLVEDSARDAAHVTLTLRRAGWEPNVRRVETREEMLSALADGEWDAIVADHQLPRFSATEALETLKATGRDIPFIVVSGVIGEDTAIRLMRDGAHDYLLKDKLGRLHAAIEREIEQAEQRKAKRRAESLFQAVLRASPHPSAIIDRTTMRVVDGSTSFVRQFVESGGLPSAGTVVDLIRFSQPERVEQLLARGSGAAWHTVYYAGGVGRVANLRCYTVEHEGGSYAYLLIEDVTEQHYLKAAFDAIPDAVLVVGSDQRLLYANWATEELFGTLYFGMDVQPLLDRASLRPRWWLVPTTRFDEHRIVIGDQPYAATSVVFRFAGETDASTILTLRNVAEAEELQHLATHDALTGAYNVRHFAAALPQHIEEGGVLALIDIDHFKPINDELGHAAGDAALILFANVIRAELRSSDVFARLGGDEFAVIFAGLTLDAASETLTRIFDRLRRSPLRFDGNTRPLSASCGVVPIAPDASAEAIKAQADRALYEAKRQGRGRWVVG